MTPRRIIRIVLFALVVFLAITYARERARRSATGPGPAENAPPGTEETQR